MSDATRSGDESPAEAGDSSLPPGAATDPSEPAGAGGGGRNLPVAIAVGIVLAALFLGSLFYDPAVFTAVLVGFTLLAVWEAGTVLAGTERTVARPVLAVSAVVMGAATYVLGPQGQVLGVLVLVFGAFGWEMAASPRVDSVGKLGTTLLLGTWVLFLASFAVLLVSREQSGAVAVLVVGGGAILGDIGGYMFGRLLGRTRIAPTVSPNKTWEGLVGGVALAAAVGFLVLPMVDEALFSSPVDGAVIAAVCAVAGFFGDLAESMVKRSVGLKDLGRLIPGHGGVLDRVDGLLFAFPVGYYALELVA